MAVGVAGFALVAIFGLIPVGLNSVSAAIRQTTAADIASSVAADLRQTPAANAIAAHALSAVSPRYAVPLSTAGTVTTFYTDDGGTYQPSLVAASTYRVVVTVIGVPAAPARTATTLTVRLSWPAPATSANAAGSLTLFVALDTN